MNKGAPASPSGSRASRQAELHRPDPAGFDPSRVSLGLYRLHWVSGGSSLASVYMDEAGQRWIAPSNWVRPGPLSLEGWGAVERLEPIKADHLLETEPKLVDCPRCHQTCGWCGDYRHLHGQIRLPGTKQRCELPFEPEGADCPICNGELRVLRAHRYYPADGE